MGSFALASSGQEAATAAMLGLVADTPLPSATSILAEWQGTIDVGADVSATEAVADDAAVTLSVQLQSAAEERQTAAPSGRGHQLCPKCARSTGTTDGPEGYGPGRAVPDGSWFDRRLRFVR